MNDLERFVRRLGARARQVRDGDVARGLDPVFDTAEDNWREFSKAVLREPTERLRELFMEGWNDV